MLLKRLLLSKDVEMQVIGVNYEALMLQVNEILKSEKYPGNMLRIKSEKFKYLLPKKYNLC